MAEMNAYLQDQDVKDFTKRDSATPFRPAMGGHSSHYE